GDARALRVRAGDAPPATAAEVTTIYAALKRGLPAPVVERIVAAMPQEPRGSALHSVADLAAHRFAPDSSASLIIDAAHQGLRGERLLDVATAVLHSNSAATPAPRRWPWCGASFRTCRRRPGRHGRASQARVGPMRRRRPPNDIRSSLQLAPGAAAALRGA